MEGSVKPKFSETSNYAWVVFAGLCMICFTVTAMGGMLFGIYLLPIAETTGAGMVSAATYPTINGWVMAVVTLLYGWLLTRVKGRQLNAMLCVNSGLAICCLLWNGLIAGQIGIYGYWIGAVISGAQGGVLGIMIAPIMISNWFGPKYRGKFLGFAAAFSSIGTMIWPPLLTSVLQTYGLSTAFLVNGVLMAIFTLPPCLLIFKHRPDNVLPWGVKSWEELQEQESSTSAGKFGFPPLKVFTKIAFWLIILCILTISFHGTFTQNEPGAAAQWLTAINSPDAPNAAMIGAFMMSCGAIGNLLSKLGVGFLIDKWGAGMASGTLVALCAVGMGGWVFLPTSLPVLYAGAFLLGMCSPVMTVGVPMLIRQIFGDRTYPQIQSYVSAATTIIGGLSSPFIAFVLVSSGGLYNSIYTFGFIFWIFGAVVLFIANRFRGKLTWVDEEGNPKPTAPAAASPAVEKA